MQIFTATDITLMGNLDPTYGQTYYGNVEEEDLPVRFNLRKQVNIMPGQQLVAQEVSRPPSGKAYWQLKKVTLSEGVAGQPQAPSPEPADEQVPMFSEEEMDPEIPITQDRPGRLTEVEDIGNVGGPGYQHAKAVRETLPMPSITPGKREVPAYEASTNARWAIGMAYREYAKVMGTPEDGGGEFPFDAVLLHAQQLMAMFDTLVSD